MVVWCNWVLLSGFFSDLSIIYFKLAHNFQLHNLFDISWSWALFLMTLISFKTGSTAEADDQETPNFKFFCFRIREDLFPWIGKEAEAHVFDLFDL